MDGRRFNRGTPPQDPPSSPHGADQDTLARLEKQLEIDEGARFYDWHGHALTGPERRAHLEAFRSNRPGSGPILPPPDSDRWAPPDSNASKADSSNAGPWNAEPWNRQAPPESEAPPPEVVETTALVPDAAVDPLASVDVDVDEFESDQRLFAIDSAAPVFALRPKAERPRRSGRPVLVGLFALCLLLVAIALAGLLRSDQPDRHATAAETPPATLVAPIGLSTETPAPAPPSAEVAPAPDLGAATAAATAASAGAPAAPGEPSGAAAKPAPAEPRAPAPPIRAQDESHVAPPPSPPIQKPAPSPSPALPRSVVPNDTPKF